MFEHNNSRGLIYTDGVKLKTSMTINIHFQVFYIIIQFSSPQPTAIRIQRKKEDSLDWEDWQYFARNCSTFRMKNNGDLETSDSVNCLQLPKYECFLKYYLWLHLGVNLNRLMYSSNLHAG